MNQDLTEVARSPRYPDEIRARAFALLAVRRIRKHVPRAIEYLTDDSIEFLTRQQLAVGMGRCRVSKASDSLIELLQHERPEMQDAAVTALGRIARPKPVLPLLARWDERDGEQRPLVLTALRRIGRRSGSEMMLNVLDSATDLLPASAVFISDDNEIRHELPIDWLQEQLASPNREARRDAVLLITLFGDKEDASLLQTLLASEQDEEIQSIAELGEQRLTLQDGPAPAFEPWAAP